MKTFTWTVQFTINEAWAADGFEMTNDRALRMLEKELPEAYEHELKAKVVKFPPEKAIRKVQGHSK